jgi:Tn3 transposase DDE domain
VLLTEIFSKAEARGRKARLRTLKALDAAALPTSAACAVLLDPHGPDAPVRAVACAGIPPDALEAARQQLARLVRPPEDVAYQERQTPYRRVRRVLPTLVRAIPFGASPAGEPVREALQYWHGREERGPRGGPEPPLAIVKKAWRHDVVRHGTVDPQAYTLCVLDRLHHARRRRELLVAPSVRYADPRSGLLEGEGWASARPFICRTLGLPPTPDEALAALRQPLDPTSRAVAAHLPHNDAVRIEQTDGQEARVVSALDKREEPPTLVALREAVKARLPRVDRPAILLAMAARTGFTEEFTPISAREARAAALATSLCAVLMAEACHIGLTPLVRGEVPARRWSRLVWVSQPSVRNDTLTEANARLGAHNTRSRWCMSGAVARWPRRMGCAS